MSSGILLLIRHGVRSSLNHVRDNSIDCSHENDTMLKKYRAYLMNSTLVSSSNSNNGQPAWNRGSSFHGFPMLPADAKICLLGQLTYKGIAQLLHVGELMKFAYAYPLDLFKRPIPAQQQMSTNNRQNNASNTIPDINVINQILNSGELVVYSTRYRRTFQSAMALLFNMLPNERWHNLQIQESHSLAYCFADCACPYAEHLKKQLSKVKSRDFSSNPTIASLVNWIGGSMLQSQDASILNPLELRDVLLMYLCHDQELPCQRRKNSQSRQHHTTTLLQSYSNDIIDLDDSQQQQQPIDTPTTGQQQQSTVDGETSTDPPSTLSMSDNCIDKSHIETLLTYTDEYELKESGNRWKIMERMLRAYGLMRNIVNYMLKMISGDKLKMVLYSSHDQTIVNVLAAIGLLEESSFVPFASRMVFEVYRSNGDPSQHYFRLLYNGHDVTRKMNICFDGKSLRVNRGRGKAAHLCPIENIIRFIHDDYFAMMNATNFKDACFYEKNSFF